MTAVQVNVTESVHDSDDERWGLLDLAKADLRVSLKPGSLSALQPKQCRISLSSASSRPKINSAPRRISHHASTHMYDAPVDPYVDISLKARKKLDISCQAKLVTSRDFGLAWHRTVETFVGEGVLNAVVQDHRDQVVFRLTTVDEDVETRVYNSNNKLVATIDWDIHLQPVLKFEGQEIKVKKWISRVPGNTGPVISHNGHLYEWVQEQFYAVVRSSPEAERKAVIYNDENIRAVEMTPEGMRDNLLLPVILFTAFTECGLVKGHGFPGPGEDTITGRIVESFLGVGMQAKRKLVSKREAKSKESCKIEELDGHSETQAAIDDEHGANPGITESSI